MKLDDELNFTSKKSPGISEPASSVAATIRIHISKDICTGNDSSRHLAHHHSHQGHHHQNVHRHRR